MSGMERPLIPNVPHLVARKTRQGQKIFLDEQEAERCIRDLYYLARLYGIEIHAWCLLPNAIYLLISPGDDPTVISTFIKAFTCRIALRRKWHPLAKPGPIWDARYLSSPVEPGSWVIATICYIEKMPARLEISKTAYHYRWSSYPIRLGHTTPYLLDDPEDYLGLGYTPLERAQVIQVYMKAGLGVMALAEMESALRRCKLLGSPAFVDWVWEEYEIYAPNRGPGRPPKKPRPGSQGGINPLG